MHRDRGKGTYREKLENRTKNSGKLRNQGKGTGVGLYKCVSKKMGVVSPLSKINHLVPLMSPLLSRINFLA